MIKQIGLPPRGRPILLITRMITDRIGLHSVLLPLLILLAEVLVPNKSILCRITSLAFSFVLIFTSSDVLLYGYIRDPAGRNQSVLFTP